jgi:hypothetical protein
MKRYLRTLVSILVVGALFSACDKKANAPDNCYADNETVRVLNDKTLTVHGGNGSWHLTEEFTYDTRLYPCNLPTEFQVDKLVVLVSGNVKAIPETAQAPCCSDGLEITSIKKAGG